MADEAVVTAVPSMGKLKYTLEEYLAFRKAIVARAKALGGGVAAEELGQALWALAKAEALRLEGDVEKGKGSTKRAAPSAPAQAKKARQK